MFSKINVLQIVSDHWGTLHAAYTKKISRWDILLFCGVPLIPVWVFWGTTANDQQGTFWNAALAALAIFAGLLLNLLVLLYGLIERPVSSSESEDPVAAQENAHIRNTLLCEVIYNVSYAVLTSIIAILLLILLMIVGQVKMERVLSSLLYFILTHFVLTMFMILKRIYALLSYEFVRREQQ